MRPDAPGIDTPDLPYHAILSELDIAGRIRGRDPVNTSLYMWQRTMLINYILTVLGDRMEMAHSVEGRVPFLDHHVSEYAASLPVHYKIRESTEKYVLREATRDVITPELLRASEVPLSSRHPFARPRRTQREIHCRNAARTSSAHAVFLINPFSIGPNLAPTSIP